MVQLQEKHIENLRFLVVQADCLILRSVPADPAPGGSRDHFGLVWIGPPVISSPIVPSRAALGPEAGWVPRAEHYIRRTARAPSVKQNGTCREVLLPMARADGLKYRGQ